MTDYRVAVGVKREHLHAFPNLKKATMILNNQPIEVVQGMLAQLEKFRWINVSEELSSTPPPERPPESTRGARRRHRPLSG